MTLCYIAKNKITTKWNY